MKPTFNFPHEQIKPLFSYLIQKKKITQTEFAHKISGRTKSAITKVLTGASRSTYIENLILKFCHVELSNMEHPDNKLIEQLLTERGILIKKGRPPTARQRAVDTTFSKKHCGAN